MDLAFSEQQEQYRLHVRKWLRENLPDGWETPKFRWPADEKEKVKLLIDWEKKLYEGGFAGISWPKEYGGQGLGVAEEIIFNQEFGRISGPFPVISINSIGKSLIGPTLLEHGTEEQKTRFLPPILKGEEIWAQGFSEPNAGSDLAASQTRAVLDGDEWIINGQKTWTTYGHHANWIFVLARTDPNVPKNKGLTFFLMPMNTPGITLRPINQLNGEKEFNETFFDDVRIPKDSYVGKINDGWKVTMSLVGYERSLATVGKQARIERELDNLFHLCRQLKTKDGQPILDNPLYRQRLTELWAKNRILGYHNLKSISQILNEGKTGPGTSLLKLFSSELHNDILNLAMEIFSKEAPYMGEESLSRGELQLQFLTALAETIYAGTSEIQRNIIARFVLKMEG